MKLTITFEQDINEDGIDGSASIVRNDVQTVEDILSAFSYAFRSAGFTYVERVGVGMKDGKSVWSEF